MAESNLPIAVSALIDAGHDREAAVRGARGDATTTCLSHGGTMDPLIQFEQLGSALAAVLAGIGPDQLDRPTPCAAFAVQGVLEHMIGGATQFAAAYRGQTPAEPDTSDPLAAIAGAMADLADAIQSPGALDRTITTPFGDMRGDVFTRMVVLDGVVHGWDLATATGQPYDPPDELVAAAEGFAREVLDPLRDGTTFADAIEPEAGTTPIERLAAFTGRRPVAEVTPLNTPTVQEQSAKLLGPLAGTATVWALELGLRLGLFDALAAHTDGATAEELAGALGLDPEYTFVILRSAFAAEVLDVDASGRFQFAEHMTGLLLDQDHPAFLGGAVRVFVAMRESFLDLRDHARTGTREWWSDFDPEWIDAVGLHCQAYYRRILDAVVPQVPGLGDHLRGGARYLDLACGTCRGPAKVVNSYPATTVTAVDADAYTLEVAEREMKERGLDDRFRFVQSYLEDLGLDGGHDVALINVSLHEARDIQAAVASAYAALDPGGIFVVSEFPFPDDPEEYRSGPGRIMCGVQFFEAHIGCQLLPATRFVELLEGAGFCDVGTVRVNPMHVVIHGRK